MLLYAVQVTVASYCSEKAAGSVSSQQSASKVKMQGEGQTLAVGWELVSELPCCAYASLFTG